MSLPVLSAAQVRELDRRSIQDLGVPSLALMEQAGLAASASLLEHFDCSGGVTVVCGRGNNGGDGWVIARHLHRRGLTVRVWEWEGARSPDCETMRAAALAHGVPTVQELGDCSVIVDALFGTGLDRPISKAPAERVAAINAHPAPVLAVDLPSGVQGEDGRVLGPAVKAQRSVFFGPVRVGHLLESSGLCGVLEGAEIGLCEPSAPTAQILDAQDLCTLLPQRGQAEHKASRGRVAVVAGSLEMAGAAVLTCLGALGMGAGLVTLHAPAAALPRLGALLPPEVMLRLDMDTGGADAVVVGPGVGRQRDAEMRELWRTLRQPAVFDADALRALGQAPEPSKHPRVITPHPGEAGGLLGWSAQEVQASRLEAVRALRGIAPVLLKGRHTLVLDRALRVNLPGGPELAVGGSGDVLAGAVGALLARGLNAGDAMAAAAWVHGWAGERLGVGLRASELALELPAALASVQQRGPLIPWRRLL